MNKVTLNCPHCAVSLKVPEQRVGTEITCPGCKMKFLARAVPEPEPAPAFLPQFEEADLPEEPAAPLEPVPTLSRATRFATDLELIKEPNRWALRAIAGGFRVTSALTLMMAVVALLLAIFAKIPISPEAEDTIGGTFAAFGVFLGLVFTAITQLAFAELIEVFCNQERLQTFMLNDLRKRTLQA